MAYHAPRPQPSLERWLRRLDRAAWRMNPLLTVLAIGLAVLNLVCLALLSLPVPITRHPSVAEDPPALARDAGQPPASAERRYTAY